MARGPNKDPPPLPPPRGPFAPLPLFPLPPKPTGERGCSAPTAPVGRQSPQRCPAFGPCQVYPPPPLPCASGPAPPDCWCPCSRLLSVARSAWPDGVEGTPLVTSTPCLSFEDPVQPLPAPPKSTPFGALGPMLRNGRGGGEGGALSSRLSSAGACGGSQVTWSVGGPVFESWGWGSHGIRKAKGQQNEAPRW